MRAVIGARRFIEPPSWQVGLGLLLGLLLSACATNAPPTQSAQALLHDELFAPAPYPIRASEVMALSPAMQAYLDTEIDAMVRAKGKRQALLDALYNRKFLQLEYDSTMTRNAAQAFEARSGNCLSLVLMTAAFAKRLELPVVYQDVQVDEQWSRSGDLYFLLGHVNLSLGRGAGRAFDAFYEAELLTIDFLPPELMRRLRSRVIDENTIIAMYMSNRAAETLNQGLVDEAYWWVRGALQQDPRYLAAYNTLAVIYRRHGNMVQAEAALRHALSAEPRNVQAMSNLVLVLQDLGRTQEAQALNQQVQAMHSYWPYQLFDRGVAAMKAGDYARAEALFAEEISHSAYVPEFHFWLALASYAQGEMGQARHHLKLAQDYSTTRRERELYGAKLAKLRSEMR